MKPKDLARFIKKINKTDTCWLWMGSVSKGYGVFSVKHSMKTAHRLIYSHYFGVIPDGMEIDHTCFNKLCVNPYHLDCVTPSVNTRRGKLNAGQVKLTYKSNVVEYCKNRHKRTIGNTYEHNGSKTCRVCQLASVRRYEARIAS